MAGGLVKDLGSYVELRQHFRELFRLVYHQLTLSSAAQSRQLVEHDQDPAGRPWLVLNCIGRLTQQSHPSYHQLY